MAEWFVAVPGSDPLGPLGTDLVRRGLEAGRIPDDAQVCRVGENAWARPSAFPELAAVPTAPHPATTQPQAEPSALPSRPAAAAASRRRLAVAVGAPLALIVIGALAFLLWPNPAKEALELGRTLESRDRPAAIAAYERVCQLAPTEADLCGAARPRAAALRLDEAKAKLQALAFGEAEALLQAAAEAQVLMVSSDAKKLASSKEVELGLRWEKALRSDERLSALRAMEQLADAKGSLAAPARRWIDKERPGILLASMRRICGSGAPDCGNMADALAKYHADSAETKEAQSIRAAWYPRSGVADRDDLERLPGESICADISTFTAPAKQELRRQRELVPTFRKTTPKTKAFLDVQVATSEAIRQLKALAATAKDHAALPSEQGKKKAVLSLLSDLVKADVLLDAEFGSDKSVADGLKALVAWDDVIDSNRSFEPLIETLEGWCKTEVDEELARRKKARIDAAPDWPPTVVR